MRTEVNKRCWRLGEIAWRRADDLPQYGDLIQLPATPANDGVCAGLYRVTAVRWAGWSLVIGLELEAATVEEFPV